MQVIKVKVNNEKEKRYIQNLISKLNKEISIDYLYSIWDKLFIIKVTDLYRFLLRLGKAKDYYFQLSNKNNELLILCEKI